MHSPLDSFILSFLRFSSHIISLDLYIIQLLTLLHGHNLIGKCSFGLLSCNNDKLQEIQQKKQKKREKEIKNLLLLDDLY